MDTASKRLYEGMFLVDSAQAASDWEGINDVIKKILEKSECEIVSMKKWDERRLAYDIAGKNRGTYILVYFNAIPTMVAGVERDIRLSERVMRAMILKTEKISEEDMNKPTPIERAESGEPRPEVREERTEHARY